VQPEAGLGGEREVVRFVGLDIGKRKCRAAIMNQEGTILDEFWFTNNHEGHL
jgi:activator of 2-hydroxyglutaryl-CoA dehydratase